MKTDLDQALLSLEVASAYAMVLIDMSDSVEHAADADHYCPTVRFVADRLSDLIHAARKAVDGEEA